MSTEHALPQIRLKIARRSSHPWIFQKMVEKPAQRLPGGSVVDIVDRDGQWVGRGFYNGHSRIALRVLTTDPNEAVDADFFRNRLDRAISLRREILRLDAVTDAYRLVHSEGDNLSGLVVDRFGPIIVLEFFAAGMYRFRDTLVEILREHFPENALTPNPSPPRGEGEAAPLTPNPSLPRGEGRSAPLMPNPSFRKGDGGVTRFYWFAEEHVQKQESFDCRSPEAPPPANITEHGLRFRVAPGS